MPPASGVESTSEQVPTMIPVQAIMTSEAYAKDAIIAWFRGEFAAANAIIDALCNHLRQLEEGSGGSEYGTVFAAIHRRRLNWIPILQMQKYHTVADVAIGLGRVAAAKRVEDGVEGGGEVEKRSKEVNGLDNEEGRRTRVDCEEESVDGDWTRDDSPGSEVTGTDFSVINELRSKASPDRIQQIRAIPDRSAPRLLGYIPTYQTTLQAWKKTTATRAEASTRSKPQEFVCSGETPSSPAHQGSGASTGRMPRRPFAGRDLLARSSGQSTRSLAMHSSGPFDASEQQRKRLRTEAPVNTFKASPSLPLSPPAETTQVRENRASPVQTAPLTAQPTVASTRSTSPEIWAPAMKYSGTQVRAGDSVKDNARVPYGLMRGTLLPRDAAAVPSDMDAALGAASQLNVMVSQHLSRVRDQLTNRNRILAKLTEKVKDLEGGEKQAEEEKVNAGKVAALAKIEAERATAEVARAQGSYTEAKGQKEILQAEVARLKLELEAREKGLEERDQKNYDDGIEKATAYYKRQVREYMQQAYAKGYLLGLSKAEVPDASPLLTVRPEYPFPPESPTQPTPSDT